MPIEHRITIAAPADAIFAVYTEVQRWHEWDPDTRQATLDGPFRQGTRGRLTPAKGRTVPMELTVVEPGRAFTVESRIPLFRMVFDHELRPVARGTEVTHRVTLSGALSMLIGPLLARRIDAGLPLTLARLKERLEAR